MKCGSGHLLINMLYVVTDSENKNWLTYILEEFARVNKARFQIQIISVREVSENTNKIFYTREYIGGCWVVNKSHVVPGAEDVFFKNDLFVISGTTSVDNRAVCRYDLFWNAFVFLSRLEEYLLESRGKRIKSYSFNHPRTNKETFFSPIVNKLFNELERIITNTFPHLEFEISHDSVIELSHDIDYLNKTLQLRIKQTAFNAFNLTRCINEPKRFLGQIYRTTRFLFSTPSYWCFDYWENLEKSVGKKSVFYVYVNAVRRGFRQWLFDPSYTVEQNKRLRDKLIFLKDEGFQIGLHGSFDSARDEYLLQREKEILERCVNCEITKVRQHWLCYQENITPYTHEKLFKFDSTLGWNDRIGFRAGCANSYRPYDHKNQRPFNFFEIPLVIMDANIFDYGYRETNKSKWLMVEKLLGELQCCKTSHVSISWHQRSCNSDYNWHILYESLVKNDTDKEIYRSYKK